VWLNALAAAGYVTYDAQSGGFTLPPEQATALGDEASPAFVPGLFAITQAMWAAIPRMQENFRTGQGLAWGDQHPCLFEGTERFFRSGYIGNLLGSWIPALDGVKEKLERGAKVADVGCGLGASTILLAKAFPRSRFFGFDSHAASIETARRRAHDAGVADRVTFSVASAVDFPGNEYDLVAHFDCLHDMEGHGRSGRRGAAGAPDPRRRRHLDDRRALRRRSARGEPQRGRPGLLCGVHDAVRAPLPALQRAGARGAGR
jgi:SAM-dependent methyltransferase